MARHRLATIPLALAAIALAACTSAELDAASATSPVAPASEPAVVATPLQNDPGAGASRPGDLPPGLGRAHPLNAACTHVARYDRYKMDGGDWTWSLTGARTDTGVADQATGTPNADLTEYVVAPGDTVIGIGARFCVDSVHLRVINDRSSGDIYADETIRLFPDGVAADDVTDLDAQSSLVHGP